MLKEGLQDFMPGFCDVEPDSENPDDSSTEQLLFNRGAFDLHKLHTTTAELCEDPAFAEESRKAYMLAFLVILDGSGTTTFHPVDGVAHTNLWCHFKGKSQLRWYIACDIYGTILFVSSHYPGRCDDNTILHSTGFYECVILCAKAAVSALRFCVREVISNAYVAGGWNMCSTRAARRSVTRVRSSFA